MTEDPRKTLFVGWDTTGGVTHYRTIVPAVAMDAEFVVFGMDGKGQARRGTNMKHDIIVLQHCWEPWQVRIARNMRKTGAKVIINVDDWITAVGKMGSDHAFSHYFRDKRVQSDYFSLLREADGIIAATPWLVEKCQSFNKRVAMARNGLDLDRYKRWHRPKDDDRIVLGWAGGTGHRGALQTIVDPVSDVLRRHEDVSLHLVGDYVIDLFPSDVVAKITQFGWEDLQFHPRRLADFHINLAPALDTDFFKAKSQLRFYEACAMGAPTIGHPMYDEIDDGWNGFIATDWTTELEALMRRPYRIEEMGRRALEYAQEIAIEKRISEWKSALTLLTSP